MITITKPSQSTTEIKKSKFITWASPVASKEEALHFLNDIKDPTATHNCWAYKIKNEYRFSDDGEPGGTAGKPILCAIEGSGVDCVIVVVIRFFGGIKLGAGGLVRAYGNAASTCLGNAEKKEIVPRCNLSFDVPFDTIGYIYSLIEKNHATKQQETYSNQGVHFIVDIPLKEVDRFRQALTDATSGTAQFHPVYLPRRREKP